MKVESRDAAALVGRKLGEFIVREQMSSGGFGLVFRAEQPALAREAVIKVLHARLRASETVIQRFLREAKLASRLDHPFAAHIYAFGVETDGLMWIAMELVRGTPLDRLLEAKGAISIERFVPLLERICQVVQTAHEQGIVHRDLKPANVMVLVRAGQLLPKLLDLGIAKLDGSDPATSGPIKAIQTPPEGTTDSLADTAHPAESSEDRVTDSGRLTEDGAVIGSPLYMAPEQWTDAAAVDARTDIYALGVLSYEALTSRPPFSGGNRIEIAMAHADRPPPPLGPGHPKALDAVIARAMAKRPGDRYDSALQLASAVRAASGIAEEVEGLPRIDDQVRIDVLTRAPEPIARAVNALHSARNAHQARDALWQLVRVATRFVGVIALAAHAQVGGGRASESGVHAALRRLAERTLPDSEWYALAKELSAPFDTLRAAYPMPELLEFLDRKDGALVELIALREDDKAVNDDRVRELLGRATPLAARMLVALGFLGDYQLVVPTEHGAERWMGLASGERSTTSLRGHVLDQGQPAFVDVSGLPVVALYPFVQVHEPAPGLPQQLFLLDGRGRRGSRLVALPEAYELEDEGLWEVVGGLLGESSKDLDRSDEEVCPYPGLSAFTSSDAGRFFGREREAEAFVNRLRAQPFLAVVGPSGAGKSSFVQAGVVPTLPDDWRVVVLRPGASPLANLAARLGNFVDPRIFRSEIDRDPEALGNLLRSREGGGVTMIVVDQFEELFTLCDDPDERAKFALLLARAARSADEMVRVVITLRDDFLLHAEALPALRTRLSSGLQLLTTPGKSDLTRILLEPLRQAGYALDDPKLVDDITGALEQARSPLALLSFTCSKLWELRDRRFRQISRKAYTSLGGVGGALSQHAEGVLTGMRPEEQRLVREVFRHAVTADGTRAVLERNELHQVLGAGVGGASEPVIAGALEKLIAARLLVSSDSATGGEQIEITHEALITGWPRLVAWRREDAEGARLRDQLRAAARQWDERGRPEGLLWRGDALAEYRLWRARYLGAIGSVDTAFADASLAQAKRAARRQTWTIIGSFAVLTIGVISLVLLNARVASQRSIAEGNEELAKSSAQKATDAAAKLRDTVVAQFEDQGRRYIVDGDPLPGLAYLDKARELGAQGAGHDTAVAFAAAAIENKQHVIEHDDYVVRARFTPDGSTILTCSYDGRARLVDRTTYALIAELRHGGPVVRVAMDRAGTVVATASYDGTASLWDAHTGAKRATFHDRDISLQGIVITPDGKLIATIAKDDIVELWGADGALLATLQGTPHPISGFFTGDPGAISGDGTRLAVGDSLGAVRIWNLATKRVLATIETGKSKINTLRFSPDGTKLVAASDDGTATVVDLVLGTRKLTLRHRQRVNAAEFSPDGRMVATASNDHTAVLWDSATGTPIRTLLGHKGAVNDLVFRPDGARLATASDDGDAAVWDVASGQRELHLVGHRAALLSVAYDSEGRGLVTSGSDHTAIVWSSRVQLAPRRFDLGPGVAQCVELFPDGTRVAAGGDEGTVRVWDLASGRVLFTVSQHGKVAAIRVSPDGARLVSVGDDQLVHIWDASSGSMIQTLQGHTGAIVDVVWFADSARLATVSVDGSARIWRLGQPAAELVVTPADGRALASLSLAPGGETAVTSSDDRSVQTWDTKTGARSGRWTTGGNTFSLEVSGDGKLVLGTTDDGVALAWTLKDGAPSLELPNRGSFISTVRWGLSYRLIFTAGFDGTIRLWDPIRKNVVGVLPNPDEVPLFALSVSPDGHHVAATTQDGIALVWEVPALPRDLSKLMCNVPYRYTEIGLTQVTAKCN